jgi:hypothetical protein
MAREVDHHENVTTKMKPTYSFEEMRDLIRKANCEKDVQIIRYMIRLEGKFYAWQDLHAMFKQLQVVERMIG